MARSNGAKGKPLSPPKPQNQSVWMKPEPASSPSLPGDPEAHSSVPTSPPPAGFKLSPRTAPPALPRRGSSLRPGGQRGWPGPQTERAVVPGAWEPELLRISSSANTCKQLPCVGLVFDSERIAIRSQECQDPLPNCARSSGEPVCARARLAYLECSGPHTCVLLAHMPL